MKRLTVFTLFLLLVGGIWAQEFEDDSEARGDWAITFVDSTDASTDAFTLDYGTVTDATITTDDTGWYEHRDRWAHIDWDRMRVECRNCGERVTKKGSEGKNWYKFKDHDGRVYTVCVRELIGMFSQAEIGNYDPEAEED